MNSFDISMGQLLRFQYRTFFGYHHPSIVYKILKTLSCIIFCVPFLIITVAEYLILTIIQLVGNYGQAIATFCFLSLLWLPIGLLLGVLYFILQKTFALLILFFTLPDVLFDVSVST